MTLILTACTKEGIHLFSDTLIVKDGVERSHMDKFVILENTVIMFYGDIIIEDKFNVFEFLEKIKKENDSSYAKEIVDKMKQELEEIHFGIDDYLGFYVCDKNFNFYHLFHDVPPNSKIEIYEFICENAHEEYHLLPLSVTKSTAYCSCTNIQQFDAKYSNYSCAIQGYTKQKVIRKYPLLYNGDNKDCFDYIRDLEDQEYFDLDSISAKDKFLEIFKNQVNVHNETMDYPINYIFISRDRISYEVIEKS